MSYHIGLVEKHKNLRDLFTHYFWNEGWVVSIYGNEKEATVTTDKKLDLWIMDILFSGADGQQLVQEMKQHTPNIPVVFISDHDRILEQISKLNLDHVYCLAKPFMPRDLVTLIHKLQGNETRLKDIGREKYGRYSS
ncbi:MAG TPA: response regulator [Bacillota bacterium]|nr:response regulator [Bacillota bacterium]